MPPPQTRIVPAGASSIAIRITHPEAPAPGEVPAAAPGLVGARASGGGEGGPRAEKLVHRLWRVILGPDEADDGDPPGAVLSAGGEAEHARRSAAAALVQGHLRRWLARRGGGGSLQASLPLVGAGVPRWTSAEAERPVVS